MTSAAEGSSGVGSAEPPATAGGRGRLLERDADVATLRRVVEAAGDGNGSLAIVEGSAGIGKTRLLSEARAVGAELGFRVLSARGGELEREFAFGLVRQLFEPLLAGASEQERAELFAGAAGLAAPLFGQAGLTDVPASGEASYATLHGLYWLAANAAFATPMLLLVDDLQWGDGPSVRWLDHMVRRLEGLPLALAVATRPPEQSEHGVLLTELLMDPQAVVLRPGALGEESVSVLVQERFGIEPDPAFVAECVRATGGNPLYLNALLLTLVAEGASPTADAAAHVQEVGPESLARAVALRLSRLPSEAGALAHAVAVLGQTAELGLAGSLAGLDRPAAVAASTDLVRAGLLRFEPTLDFAHPVIRTSIYESIGAVERSEAHRRAAGLLSDSGAEPERVAAHLLLVPPTGDTFVTATLRKAAAHVAARGSAKEAVMYLRRALAENPPDEERGEILGVLGEIERGVDLPAAIEHLREAVRLTRDPRRHADFAIQCARALSYAVVDNAEVIELYRTTIELARSEGRPKLVEVATAELIHANWADPEYWPTAKELIAGVREEELTGGFASDFLLALLAHHEQRLGVDRARSVELARRALTAVSLHNEGSEAVFYALNSFRAAGEYEVGLAAYETSLASARKRGDLLSVGGLLGFRGWLLIDQGDLRAAEPDVRESIEFTSAHGTAIHAMYSSVFLADFLLELGELDEAEAVLARTGVGDAPRIDFHFVDFMTSRGRLRLAQRRPEEALADFAVARSISEGLELQNPAEWPWRSCTAVALHALGRTDEALELAEEELALAERWGAPLPVAAALRTLAALEGDAAGEARLRTALEVLSPSSVRLERAKVLVDLGSAIRRGNERSAARELLEQGVDLATRCGALALAARANEELAATGARPRKVSLTGLDSLTASERRVAQLAAEELSNKEIAQSLFVTVKTVEVHLSNVYRKLQISSRRQLPAALVQPQGALSGLSA